VGIFPFNHILDDELFIQLAQNGEPKYTNNLYCENYLFNPFDLNSDGDHSPFIDNDPDSNYYDVHSSDYYESRYYDSIGFNYKISPAECKIKQISMIHCNIRSANKNANNFSNYLKSLNHNFDVIAFTETWHNENNTDINGFQDYNHEYNYRKAKRIGSDKTKKGGGVSILVKDNLSYNIIPQLKFATELFESLFLEIDMHGKNIIIGCIYRTPGHEITLFNKEMENILKTLNKMNKHVYILGDFNINLLNTNNHSQTNDFINIMFSSSFIPLINRPTRVQDDSITLIDNIYTNRHELENHFNGIIPTDVSDHFSIFHIMYHNLPLANKHEQITTRAYSAESIHNFKSSIHNKDWSSVLQCSDVNSAYETFFNTFNNTFNANIPMKQLRNQKVINKPWISKGILTSIVNKNKLYKTMKVSGDSSLKHKYKTIKNKLSKILRLAEKKYYKNLLDTNKNNLNKTWKTLNLVINKKKRSFNNIKFIHNNKEYSNNEDIANKFSQYFLNVPKTLCSKIPSNSFDPCQYITNNVEKSLFLNPTDKEEIVQIITMLNNSSSGYDDVNMKLLKSVKHDILTPLLHICNLSLEHGKFPDKLKIAKVVPIFKKGDKQLFDNYRPVSILPAFSKIIEKLVYKRIIHFLDKHNILYKYQFGFRQGRSTEMALFTMTNQ